MAFLAAGTTIGDALIRIGADTRQMRAQMAAMNAEVRGEMAATGQTIQRQTQSWGKAFHAVKLGVLGLGVGLAAFTVGAIKAAADFDKAMSQVYALTGITRDALDTLKKQTLELAKVVPQSPKQLAEGLYYIISSGFEAADALKILEVSAKDAAVGMTDTQTVADGLTSAMNAYAVSGEKAAEFSDIMTQTIVQGKAEWADLARSIGAVSVQGATAGLQFKEVSSAIANLTQVGLTAQRGSRNLAFLIRALESPNNIASKTFENLGLKVDETTLKEKGLIGMLQMMSKAAGQHHDVIVKNNKGQIDWDKSLAATEKANKGWAKSMSTMTGGAAGFLVAQILLQKGGAKYNDILKSMDQSAGLTAQSFDRMKETSPALTFELLKNKITVAAIEWGTKLMPRLNDFVGWLVDAVPAAFKTLGDLWAKYLERPVHTMIGAFGHLAAAIGSIFGGESTGDADGFRTVLDGVAAVFGKIVDYVSLVAEFMANVFSNPAVQAITRVLTALLLVKGALRVILGLGGSLDRSFRGLANRLTGGLVGGAAAKASGDPSLNASARNLDTSAAELKGAAAALKGAAATSGLGGLAGLGQGTGPGGALRMLGAAGPSMAVASMEADIARAAYARVTTATQAYMRGMAQPMAAGERAAFTAGSYNSGLNLIKNTAKDVARGVTGGVGAIKSGFSAAKGALSTGLGLASRAFWPLMIASIGVEFIKAPLGDFLAKNTPWKRAAASMKDDFFGGLVNMVKAWNIGSDLFVALPQINLGRMPVKTESLGKFDLSQAQIDRLTSGGITGSLEEQTITPSALAALQQQRDESVQHWYARIKDVLDENGVDTSAIQKALSSTSGRFGPSPAALASARTAIAAMVGNFGTMAQLSVQQVLTEAVENALSSLGFSESEITTIPPDVRQKLAKLLQGDIHGQYTDLLQYTATQALKDAGSIKKNITAADILKRRSQLDPETRRGLMGLAPGEAANTAFTESLTKNVGPAQAAYREWWTKVVSDPTGNLMAIKNAGQAFIDKWGAQIRGAKTDEARTALAKKIGVSWSQAVMLLSESEGATGASLLKAMTKQLRATILQAAKDGSKTAVPEAASILFSNLASKDLWGKIGGKFKPADIAKMVLGDMKGTDAQALLKSWKSFFPKGSEAGTAKGFKDAYNAWVTAGMLDSSKPDALSAALSPLPDIADNTKQSMDSLRDAAESARIKLAGVASILSSIGGTPTRAPNDDIPTRNDRNHKPNPTGNVVVPHAAHLAFGGYKPFGRSAWAGEFGPELLPPDMAGNVTSHSKVQSMMAAMARAAARGRGGSHQTLDVENMYLNSGPERESILEAIEFLSPAGR